VIRTEFKIRLCYNVWKYEGKDDITEDCIIHREGCTVVTTKDSTHNSRDSRGALLHL